MENKPTSKNNKSVKRNYFYNLAYQLFLLITPLVTTPYISRVLGSSGVGQYSFTYSIITYFVLFGALGFGYYAQREIARVRDDKREQTKVFYEILIARLISVLVSLGVHILIIFTGVYGVTYSKLMWILSINIIATAFDVTFLFQGNEEFGIIALINTFIKIIGIILIIVFVKNESHVWVYALCQSIALVLSNIVLWIRVPKLLSKEHDTRLNIKRHIIPTLRLFVPTIAVSVYTILDKTLIGLLIPGKIMVEDVEKNICDIENGFYDSSEKIIKMAMTIITSLSTVMIPRNSYALSVGDIDSFKLNINKALRFVFFLGIPIMFGLIAISYNFSPWFFGNGFDKVPLLMSIMSPLVLLIGLSSVLGLQYLLPQKKDKKYTIAITSGAILNFVLNIFLISLYWSIGAAIATISAEIVVTSLMFFFAKDDINIINLLKTTWKYIIAGVIMFTFVYVTQLFLSPAIVNTFILILEGIGSYFVTLLALKDDFVMLSVKRIIHRVFKKKDVSKL